MHYAYKLNVCSIWKIKKANVNFEILPYKEYYLPGWVIEVPNYAVVITKKVGDLRSETKGP